VPSDGEIARGVGGIADSDGYTGISPDVAHLLVPLHRVNDHVLTVRVDPGLGRLRRAVGHQRGDEAWARTPHQLDEAVREIHHDDVSARLRTSNGVVNVAFGDGWPLPGAPDLVTVMAVSTRSPGAKVTVAWPYGAAAQYLAMWVVANQLDPFSGWTAPAARDGRFLPYEESRMDRTAIENLQMHGQDIPWLLEHWASHKPDHPALVWDPPSGEARRWTYSELLHATRGIAAGLRDHGVEVGDKVLIHAENSPEMLLAWLACSTLGAVAVTTNTRSVAAEVAYFAEHAGCVAAIADSRHADTVALAAPTLKWIAVIADEEGSPADVVAAESADRIPFAALAGQPDSWTGRPIEPMLPFGIMFTSGTTSRPKAVVHTHANAIWASRIGPRNIDLGTNDRYLIYLPLFHVNAQSWSFFSVLGVGATAVLMPKWSSSRFWDVVAANEITHISLMPFCIGTIAGPDRPASTTLRIGVFGLIMDVLDSMLGIEVYAAYGMTETVIHATNGKPSEHLPDRSMGHVTPGYEFAVVDKEAGTLCGEGETGELWLRGTRGIQLFLEYYDNEEANAKAFEDGWFKTGDMVMLGPGGNLFYRERDKDLLKVGGENVSAREVEDVITTVPGVAQVAVVGKHHDFLDQVVVAFVVTASGIDEDALETQVIETCRERLADYKVPRAVYAVDEFPLGTLDKVLKNRLREMADERPPV